MLLEPSQHLGPIEQRLHAEVDQVRRGLRAGDEKRLAKREDLSRGEPIGTLAGGEQVREQVVARFARAGRDQPIQIGVERIHRFAFELAKRRPRKLLTLVTKSNAQRHGMVLWDEIFYEVAKKYPEVQTDRILVDAMTTRMVLKPASLDTIVATNLHADILSDLAAALSGSLGIAPTANLNPERKFPSMFEPIHGSAFDITGKGVANPIATFWTAAMMLEHLGEAKGAARLMKAIERTTEEQVFTPDLGGVHDTRAVTRAVLRAL